MANNPRQHQEERERERTSYSLDLPFKLRAREGRTIYLGGAAVSRYVLKVVMYICMYIHKSNSTVLYYYRFTTGPQIIYLAV